MNNQLQNYASMFLKDGLSKCSESQQMFSSDHKPACFVPQRINSLFMKRNSKRGKYPVGVSYNKKDKIYTVQCNNDILPTSYIGAYKTSEEAFIAYKKFKEQFIKIIADRYKEQIPEILYNALYKYEVSIYD